MSCFFTYEILQAGQIVRKGKGQCAEKSTESVERYLKRRYGRLRWDQFRYFWHDSEAAAFKHETRIIDAYVRVKGQLPPWNSLRGGGGGQTYITCKALNANGKRCSNLALAGNYGYCGVHRR